MWGRWEKKRIRRNQEKGAVIVVNILTTASRTMHVNESVCLVFFKFPALLRTQDDK